MFIAMLVLFGAREAGCFREVAALLSIMELEFVFKLRFYVFFYLS